MPSGGTIKVACRNVYVREDERLPVPDGRYVLVTIRDEGKGISAEVLPRIFDPYFTTKEGGKGLGLSTVYSIVKNHDGYITASTELGIGTTFFIYLPALDVPAEISSLHESVGERSENSSPKGRILIMDDEENIRDVVAEMLGFIGYEAVLSRDGEEAVRFYKEALLSGKPFSAVLMDLTIPGGMGGREAIKVLREIDPEARCIVSSGYSNDPILSDYRSFGFQGIITKPYKLAELKDILARVIEEDVSKAE
jgi:two-component system cell cycle sensor histidine kinase/response regulator CckA